MCLHKLHEYIGVPEQALGMATPRLGLVVEDKPIELSCVCVCVVHMLL